MHFVRWKNWFRRLAALLALSLAAGALAGQGARPPQPAAPPAAPPAPAPPVPIWSAQIGWLRGPGQAWRGRDFARLARAGINQVEINLDWGAIEPRRGQFDFRLLDRDLANAAAARLRLVLIFWESIWDGPGMNPPAWLPQRDRTSDGIATAYPPWWDADALRAYFHYLSATLDHVRSSPGFGGLFVSYGWLDAEWGPAPKGSRGVGGYAPADLAQFHRWLPLQFRSLVQFNRHWNTDYAGWKQVPAAIPGQPLFALYQQFRRYSVAAAYDALSRLVRRHTAAPLYYYWGGGLGGAGGVSVLGNDPDLFFRLARKYRATVVLDDADHAGLALLFGSLAQAYQVPLLEEWTPRAAGLRAEAAAWLAHYGLGMPQIRGEDFFLFQTQHPGREFLLAWPLYLSARAPLAAVQGSVPWQSVALQVPTGALGTSVALAPAPGLAAALGDFWRRHHVLPALVTDTELHAGVMRPGQFTQIFPLPTAGASAAVFNAALAALSPYAGLNPESADLTIVPVVKQGSAWLLLANRGAPDYQGELRLALPQLGLPTRAYAAAAAFPARLRQSYNLQPAADGWISWPLALPAGALQIWRLSPR